MLEVGILAEYLLVCLASKEYWAAERDSRPDIGLFWHGGVTLVVLRLNRYFLCAVGILQKELSKPNFSNATVLTLWSQKA